MTRTATIQKKICSFDELSKEVQAKVLEKYRNREVDHDSWHDPIIEGIKEELEAMGFKDVAVGFSGFWSQGDGASFTAKSIDVEKYIKHFKLGKLYPTLLNYAKRGEVYGFVVRDKYVHYVHENTTSVYIDASFGHDEKGTEQLKQFELSIQKQVYTFNKEIYSRLKKYYEELTSDESVKQWIEANIEEFEEDGTPYTEKHLEEAGSE
jgi:hypothetical protein